VTYSVNAASEQLDHVLRVTAQILEQIIAEGIGIYHSQGSQCRIPVRHQALALTLGRAFLHTNVWGVEDSMSGTTRRS
jgi:hypothetical protein